MEHRRRLAAAIHRPGAARERQHHQGVLQALGLVHGHHFDQVRVAFQAQNFFLALLLDLLGQVANQRVLAIEFGGAALQPFGQVQQVGQAALALFFSQQTGRHLEGCKQPAQHGQHTLLLPQHAEVAEPLHMRFPAQLVLVQLLQVLPGNAHAAGGQCRTQQAVAGGLGAGPQDAQQVGGFFAFEYRVAVRQINAGQFATRKGLANSFGFLAAAYQNGDIGRLECSELAIAVAQARGFFCTAV